MPVEEWLHDAPVPRTRGSFRASLPQLSLQIPSPPKGPSGQRYASPQRPSFRNYRYQLASAGGSPSGLKPTRSGWSSPERRRPHTTSPTKNTKSPNGLAAELFPPISLALDESLEVDSSPPSPATRAVRAMLATSQTTDWRQDTHLKSWVKGLHLRNHVLHLQHEKDQSKFDKRVHRRILLQQESDALRIKATTLDKLQRREIEYEYASRLTQQEKIWAMTDVDLNSPGGQRSSSSRGQLEGNRQLSRRQSKLAMEAADDQPPVTPKLQQRIHHSLTLPKPKVNRKNALTVSAAREPITSDEEEEETKQLRWLPITHVPCPPRNENETVWVRPGLFNIVRIRHYPQKVIEDHSVLQN